MPDMQAIMRRLMLSGKIPGLTMTDPTMSRPMDTPPDASTLMIPPGIPGMSGGAIPLGGVPQTAPLAPQIPLGGIGPNAASPQGPALRAGANDYPAIPTLRHNDYSYPLPPDIQAMPPMPTRDATHEGHEAARKAILSGVIGLLAGGVKGAAAAGTGAYGGYQAGANEAAQVAQRNWQAKAEGVQDTNQRQRQEYNDAIAGVTQQERADQLYNAGQMTNYNAQVAQKKATDQAQDATNKTIQSGITTLSKLASPAQAAAAKLMGLDLPPGTTFEGAADAINRQKADETARNDKTKNDLATRDLTRKVAADAKNAADKDADNKRNDAALAWKKQVDAQQLAIRNGELAEQHTRTGLQAEGLSLQRQALQMRADAASGKGAAKPKSWEQDALNIADMDRKKAALLKERYVARKNQFGLAVLDANGQPVYDTLPAQPADKAAADAYQTAIDARLASHGLKRNPDPRAAQSQPYVKMNNGVAPAPPNIRVDAGQLAPPQNAMGTPGQFTSFAALGGNGMVPPVTLRPPVPLVNPNGPQPPSVPVHHSQTQPRTQQGQFNGPPKRGTSKGGRSFTVVGG